MKKKLLSIRIVLLSIVLLVIGCMATPTEICAASKRPGQVKSVNVKSDNCKTVKISWKKLKGAKGYQIYRAASKKGKYYKIKTTKNTVYTDRGLTQGRRYYYKVRAYSGNRKGRYSSSKSAVVKSHNWQKIFGSGHYETKTVQVPFSQANAPWNQAYNIYRCLCNECQTYNINYGMQEALMMKHMEEVDSPGWVEEIYEPHDFCNNCGKDIDIWFGEDSGLHTIQCGPKGWTNKLTLVRTIEHRATSKNVWMQDVDIYCTRCGKNK